MQVKNGNYEFDLWRLNDSTIGRLRNFVQNCLKRRTKLMNAQNCTSQNEHNTTKRCFISSDDQDSISFKKLKFYEQSKDDNKKDKNDNKNDDETDLNEQSSNYCEARERLKDKICYVCGLISKSNKITENTKKKYKERFGSDLIVSFCTPETVCGTCKTNLLSNKNRKFRFFKPMIWRKSFNHNKSIIVDCYFCSVEDDETFFENKHLSNYPESTTCSLPKYFN